MLIISILDAPELALVRERLAALPFGDGKATAGPMARQVKANTQADGDSPETRALASHVREALMRNDTFATMALPRRFSTLLFSRYGVGDRYGLHVDNALMGKGESALRADIAFTLFLSDPDSYEGGALRIHQHSGHSDVRLAAGQCVLYPSSTLHEVLPVTRGVREVCVGWVHSWLRSSERREVIGDLAIVRLRARDKVDSETLLRLDRVQAHLLRMWADD
jgi:PKHD-type hydroxylase